MQPEMTKPNRKKNRMNTGGHVLVCAGISGGRIVLWEYLSRSWSGQAAADLYAGPILKTLKKHRGDKRKYLLVEDNDRTGYKSKKAMAAKAAAKIEAIEWPKYSPDLNPLDYAIWDAIEARMKDGNPSENETVQAYRQRLRRTALRLPEAVVRKAVAGIPARMKAVVEAKGGNIPRD